MSVVEGARLSRCVGFGDCLVIVRHGFPPWKLPNRNASPLGLANPADKVEVRMPSLALVTQGGDTVLIIGKPPFYCGSRYGTI
jgi:hypothetical protein